MSLILPFFGPSRALPAVIERWTMHEDPIRPAVFVRWPELLAEVPLGQNSIRDMIARGDFPSPVPLGLRAVGFVRDEIEAWKAERIAARRGHGE